MFELYTQGGRRIYSTDTNIAKASQSTTKQIN